MATELTRRETCTPFGKLRISYSSSISPLSRTSLWENYLCNTSKKRLHELILVQPFYTCLLRLLYGRPNLRRYSVEFIKPLTIVRKSPGCVLRWSSHSL